MTQHHESEVLILGSGPAGLTAAVYAARAGLDPMLVHGIQPGGQMTITTDVENYPGFADVVQGPWLMEQMTSQALNVGTRVFNDIVTDVDLDAPKFHATGDTGDTYSSSAIIVATGAQAKWLGLPGESRFQGFGVSACATCDGFFFRGRTVCVVGGGNTAVEEALYLTRHATRVILIHRRDTLRAEKILQKRLFSNPSVEIMWDTVVDDILGDDELPTVTGVRVRNVTSGASQILDLDGVFIAIGHAPNTEIFRDHLEMDDDGYIITAPDSTATSRVGVFAAGDVQDKVYRQAVTAAGTGCMAALEVEKFLSEREHSPGQGQAR